MGRDFLHRIPLKPQKIATGLVAISYARSTANQFGHGLLLPNGAITGAFARAFNEEVHRPDFDAMSDQEMVDWVVSNADLFGIEIPKGWTVRAKHIYVKLRKNDKLEECGTDPTSVDKDCKSIQGATYRGRKEIVVFGPGLTPGPSIFLLPTGDGIAVAESARDGGIEGRTKIGMIRHLSRAGRVVMLIGHEAAHARGIENIPGDVEHPEANQYGLEAYMRFKALFEN